MGAFTQTAAALLAGKSVNAALLFVITFNDGNVVRLWTGFGNFSDVSGNLYEGAGQLVSAENVDASIGTSVPNTSFKMSGVDAGIVALANTELDNVTGALVTVAVQTFNEAWQALDPPVGIGAWIGDQLSFTRQGPGLHDITLSAVSFFATRSRPQGRFYSDADQQSLYPGDTAAAFVATLVSKNIDWPLQEFL